MSFIRNAWYVAALADELVPGQLLARTLLDEPLVFYRDDQGRVRALTDRCPHRFAPLSMGRLCDGGASVQCPYHGLRFDGTGVCVHNPHGDGVRPKAAAVKSWAVTERHGFVWFWAGAAETADTVQLPDLSDVTSAPEHATIRGYLPTACDYRLLADNIMDLTHVDYLHPASLGNGSVSRVRAEVTEPNERSVHVAWRVRGEVAPPSFDPHLPTPGQPADQWTEATWTAPCLMRLDVGATPQGAPREQGVRVAALHIATPEVAGRCHYWYWSARNFAISEQANAHIKPIIESAFIDEDKPMLEAQQRRLGAADFWSLKPVLLASDAGAVRMRRKLDALMAQEQADH